MNDANDVKVDRALVEKARQHIAAMTPEELKQYAERIAKLANSTPEKTLMILQAIPEAWTGIKIDEQQSKEASA